MYAVIEPTGCSVRRGAVQIRIDLFEDDKDAPFHSHFIQLSPDATDDGIKKEVKKVLDGFGGEYEKGGDLVAYYHRNKKKHYKPFNVDAKTEELVFNALREGNVPQIVGETMSAHLVRSAIKGLDIAARKDEFKAVR